MASKIAVLPRHLRLVIISGDRAGPKALFGEVMPRGSLGMAGRESEHAIERRIGVMGMCTPRSTTMLMRQTAIDIGAILLK
jgi:hypothetical protein